jgi:thiol-disulfide isomerase/thioredoxin
MRLWKLLLDAALVVVATVSISRSAAAATPFTEEAFQASQRQGKPILVQITASWSPVCARQRRIVGLLQAEPRFEDLIVYSIDFDDRKDLVREMGAQEQSTLIVFKGMVEKGRSTGENDPAVIESLIAKASE